jgi:hypothetical protein
MENFETKTVEQPDVTELQNQLASLRSLVISVLVLILVISGTLNLYLLRQVRDGRRDLMGIRPQVMQMVAEYNKVHAPLMKEFVEKVTEYSKTHPDFAPILAKYGIKPNATPTAQPMTAPKTAVPAVPAKK